MPLSLLFLKLLYFFPYMNELTNKSNKKNTLINYKNHKILNFFWLFWLNSFKFSGFPQNAIQILIASFIISEVLQSDPVFFNKPSRIDSLGDSNFGNSSFLATKNRKSWEITTIFWPIGFFRPRYYGFITRTIANLWSYSGSDQSS